MFHVQIHSLCVFFRILTLCGRFMFAVIYICCLFVSAYFCCRLNAHFSLFFYGVYSKISIVSNSKWMDAIIGRQSIECDFLCVHVKMAFYMANNCGDTTLLGYCSDPFNSNFLFICRCAVVAVAAAANKSYAHFEMDKSINSKNWNVVGGSERFLVQRTHTYDLCVIKVLHTHH